LLLPLLLLMLLEGAVLLLLLLQVLLVSQLRSLLAAPLTRQQRHLLLLLLLGQGAAPAPEVCPWAAVAGRSAACCYVFGVADRAAAAAAAHGQWIDHLPHCCCYCLIATLAGSTTPVAGAPCSDICCILPFRWQVRGARHLLLRPLLLLPGAALAGDLQPTEGLCSRPTAWPGQTLTALGHHRLALLHRHVQALGQRGDVVDRVSCCGLVQTAVQLLCHSLQLTDGAL
jgi:hypothetical protein